MARLHTKSIIASFVFIFLVFLPPLKCNEISQKDPAPLFYLFMTFIQSIMRRALTVCGVSGVIQLKTSRYITCDPAMRDIWV